eukprot:Phypoly_transcript_07054.p1 GENE.Phypoly_transcript_07054~~Phypoly_transcript_07054.p1  ORF type:complete len:546 (+),score=67.69 Phypoly_transcript_07054:56-1639(+)
MKMEGYILAGDAEKFTATLISLVGVGLSHELLLKSLALVEEKEKEEKIVEEPKEEDHEDIDDFTEDGRVRDRHSVTGSGDIEFEVLERVFWYLDYPTLCKASEVCRKWHDFALNPVFWSNFTPSEHAQITLPFLSCDDAFDMRALLRLPRFTRLHSLHLTPWKDVLQDDWLVANLGHLHAMRHLSLQDCCRVAFENPDLASCLPNLTCLNLGTMTQGQLVSNNSLAIIRQLTNLRKIDLHYCEKINDYGLQHLTALPKLRFLDLGDCYKVSSAGLSILTPLSSSLTWLSLKSHRRSNTFIKDEGLKHLTAFTRLTHLDIGWCKRITDSGMKSIGTLRNLTHLGLASTPITDVGLHELRFLKNIRVIDITFCHTMTTEAAVMVTTNYPMLKVINFRGIRLGDHDAMNLLRLGECRSLEEIDFTNTYIDDTILAAQYCKQGIYVKKVNVSYNSLISDIAIYNLCIYMPRLTHLILSHCPKLTDKTLEHVKQAKHLKLLEIIGIYSFSKNALCELALSCPNLKIIEEVPK